MNTAFRVAGVFGPSLLCTTVGLAHPGHGEPGAAHHLTEATHVVPVLLAASVILCVVIAMAVRNQKRTLATAKRHV